MSRRRARALVVLAAGLVVVVAVFVVQDTGDARRSQRTVVYKSDFVHGEADGPRSQDAISTSGWELNGVIHNTRDEPVEGAVVTWFGRHEEDVAALSGDEARSRQARSDKRGRFVLTVPVDLAVVVVRHPRYRVWRGQQDRTVGESPRVITLEQGATIRGIVMAKGGGPVPQATVTARAGGCTSPSVADPGTVVWGPRCDVALARTDDGGRFEFGGLEGGPYLLDVSVRGMLLERSFEMLTIVRPNADVVLTIAPYAYAIFDLVDAQTGASVKGLKRLSARPDVGYLYERMVSQAEPWVGSRVLHTDGSRNRYSWLVALAEWPLGEGATATVMATVPGYRDVKSRVPLHAAWCDGPVEATKVVMERDDDAGVVRIEFVDGDGNALRDVRATLLLADAAGKWRGDVNLSVDENGAAEIVLPSGVYNEYEDQEHARVWRCSPVSVVPKQAAVWRLQLRACFVRMRLAGHGDSGIMNACATAATFAVARGGQGVQVEVLPDGRVEGARRRLSEVKGPGAGWVLGPFEEGMYSFVVEVPGVGTGMFTAELRGGAVNEVECELK